MVKLFGAVWQKSNQFWLLVVLLLLVFATGGSGRADVQSLVVLRPIAIIICGVAFWTLRREHVASFWFLFAVAMAIIALVSVQLVPLPPAVWSQLPGRDVMVNIDDVANINDAWRPISLVPMATLNSLYALFVPLAVLLLGVQINREERFALLPVIIGLGVLSGLLGLLQSVGDRDGALYFYRITNSNSAVGLFANRNHQALLLSSLFPMLAVYAFTGVRTQEQLKFKGGVAIAVSIVLIPLLLVTGSRAGLALGLIGLLTAPLLYRKPVISIPRRRKAPSPYPLFATGAFIVLLLGAATALMSRAEAFQRLLAGDTAQDLRWQVWGPIAEMGKIYFPFGSGTGSFAATYQLHETVSMLQISYLNQAHNDWLDLLLTSGIFGMLIAAVVIIAFLKQGYRSFTRPPNASRNVPFARLGAVGIVIAAVASVGDYPLRTPIMASLFVIWALWLCAIDKTDANNSRTI